MAEGYIGEAVYLEPFWVVASGGGCIPPSLRVSLPLDLQGEWHEGDMAPGLLELSHSSIAPLVINR